MKGTFVSIVFNAFCMTNRSFSHVRSRCLAHSFFNASSSVCIVGQKTSVPDHFSLSILSTF